MENRCVSCDGNDERAAREMLSVDDEFLEGKIDFIVILQQPDQSRDGIVRIPFQKVSIRCLSPKNGIGRKDDVVHAGCGHLNRFPGPVR